MAPVAAFSMAPRPPVIGQISAESRQSIAANISRFADETDEWIVGLVRVRDAYASVLSGAAELDEDDGLSQQLQNISEFIDRIAADISQSASALRESELSAERTKKMMPTPALKAFATSQLSKLVEAWTRQHNARVELYYYLLALRAEYDPEARIGPSFSDPDELAQYLDEMLKA